MSEQSTEMLADIVGWLDDLGESKVEVDNRFVMPGDTQTFTVTLSNRTTGVIQVVTATNKLPEGLDYITDSLSGPATYDPDSNEFLWSGVLMPGNEMYFTYEATPQTTAGYINRVEIEGGEGLVPFGRGVFVQAGGANLSESTVQHDLGPMIDGERLITMTMNLNNVGNALARDITATAYIPGEMNYLTDTISLESGNAVFTNSTVIWTGTLAPNISIGVSATFTSSNPFIDEWVLSNLRIDDADAARWFVYDPQFFPSKKAWFPFIGQDTGNGPPND